MGSRLRRITSKNLRDGKELSDQGKITDKVFDSLQEYYENAIKQSTTLDEMHKHCWATFFHKSSTDTEPQHGLCPIDADSWCNYNRAAVRGLPFPEKYNSLPSQIMSTIKPIVIYMFTSFVEKLPLWKNSKLQ